MVLVVVEFVDDGGDSEAVVEFVADILDSVPVAFCVFSSPPRRSRNSGSRFEAFFFSAGGSAPQQTPTSRKEKRMDKTNFMSEL